jgi:hypothetical protein
MMRAIKSRAGGGVAAIGGKSWMEAGFDLSNGSISINWHSDSYMSGTGHQHCVVHLYDVSYNMSVRLRTFVS